MGSTITYISTAMVRSFGRAQTGVYTCRATVSSMSSFLVSSTPTTGAARVTVGKAKVINFILLSTCSSKHIQVSILL